MDASVFAASRHNRLLNDRASSHVPTLPAALIPTCGRPILLDKDHIGACASDSPS